MPVLFKRLLNVTKLDEMIKRIKGNLQLLAAQLPTNRSTKNVIWNLLGGAWTGILILLATPWYVSRLGLEGYGILGIWLMMQVMMGLLDIGMGATLVKELAASGRPSSNLEYKRNLLRTLEIVYWLVAGILTLALVVGAEWIGSSWLKSDTLSSTYITNAFRLMAIALGLQFPYALYLNGLAGLQEQGRMNAIQIIGNSLRYGCGVAVLFWRADLVWFFAVQMLVAVSQTLATRWVVWTIITEKSVRQPDFRLEILKNLWRFSMGMALTAVAATLLANADRIVLSKMASITELGKYTVAFTATGLLQLGIQPFYRAFFPRYSELVSSGKTIQLHDEYFRSSRLMASVILPLGLVGWLFANQLFNIWLGTYDQTIIDVFKWLLIGITCSGLMWLPAAFQHAHGWTRLHAAMIAGAFLLGTPVMVWCIDVYGTVGATVVWVVHGVSEITLGLWLMHRRLLIGKLFFWYRSVLLPPFLLSLSLATVSSWAMPYGLNNWINIIWIGVTALIVLASTLIFNSKRTLRGFK